MKHRMINFLVMRIKEGFLEEVAFKLKPAEEEVKKTKCGSVTRKRATRKQVAGRKKKCEQIPYGRKT